ncbi:MAG TPA: hypothetical protein PLL33_10710 [Paracoccus sp. (in: a-proteobacteria)]|nr:hypothetical protein [Paracoccus sp. (in: a-proteobacteria)]
MTNSIALALALILLGLFAFDAAVLDGGLPVRIGRLVTQMVEWLSFWR